MSRRDEQPAEAPETINKTRKSLGGRRTLKDPRVPNRVRAVLKALQLGKQLHGYIALVADTVIRGQKHFVIAFCVGSRLFNGMARLVCAIN